MIVVIVISGYGVRPRAGEHLVLAVVPVDEVLTGPASDRVVGFTATNPIRAVAGDNPIGACPAADNVVGTEGAYQVRVASATTTSRPGVPMRRSAERVPTDVASHPWPGRGEPSHRYDR